MPHLSLILAALNGKSVAPSQGRMLFAHAMRSVPARRNVIVIEEYANAGPDLVAAISGWSRIIHRDAFPDTDDIATLLRDEPTASALFVCWNTNRDGMIDCLRRFRSVGFLGSIGSIASGATAMDQIPLSEIYELGGYPLVSAPDLAATIERMLDAEWPGWFQVPNTSAIAVLKTRYSLTSHEMIELLFPTDDASERVVARFAKFRERRKVLAAIEERVGRSADDLRLEFASLRARAEALVR